ncbi:penicillin-binding transpeptidase domain-containing protein [Vibrio mediterranei]|uniref:penicillin-binding transpeptidase domain-containing protein n=1 Tax=Vibrio mediterranei TaxID=689 RepID=UPI003990455A
MDHYHVPWYQVSSCIEQGYRSCTPLQLAMVTSVLVNHGKKVVPHLLKRIVEHGHSFKQQRTNKELCNVNKS